MDSKRRTTLSSLTSRLQQSKSKTMSNKLPFNSSKSSNSSNSSDSTRKRFHRGLVKEIKQLPIGDAYEHVLEHVFEHLQNLHEVEEIPDKYRYPLRDDKKYKYVLRKEIPIDKLIIDCLYSNPSPGVFEVLYDNNYKIDWSILAKHPDAFTEISQIENIIKSGVSSEFWLSLCENTNPMVIKFIEEKINKEKEEYKRDYVIWHNEKRRTFKEEEEYKRDYEKRRTFKEKHYIKLAKNPTPEAIKLVKDRIDEYRGIKEIEKYIKFLCMNPTLEAIKLLESNIYAIQILNKDYVQMYDGTSYSCWTELLANPKAINFIKKRCKWRSQDKEWNYLQKNPNPKAFTLLVEKRSYTQDGVKLSVNIIYNYDHLSENPSSKAIKLLKEKMEQEKLLSKDDYYRLRNEIGVSKFLNWIKISKNPRAKSLILAKIEEEKGREKEIAEDRKNGYSERNLDWNNVSANPAIFKRTRKMADDKAEEEKAKKIEEYLHPLPITPAN